jgi:hypothetical protein
MFIVPRVRTEDRSTSGGGSMMAGCGPCGAVFLKAARRSGGGATTEFVTFGEIRLRPEAKTTGGGAMASWGRCDESSSDQLRMFGNATSRFSLTTGAATIV